MNEIIVFSKEWFEAHQKAILCFANTLYGRYVLRIHGKRSGVGSNKIIKIEPHAITWMSDDKFVTEFRTHDKFAKRLYYAFKPFWYLLHGIDALKVPKLNFGFDSLVAYPDAGEPGVNTYDSEVTCQGKDESFSAIRNDNGNSYAQTATQHRVALSASTTSDQFARIRRTILLFKTDSIGTNAISAATIALKGSTGGATGVGSGEISIAATNTASNTQGSANDYQTFSFADMANRISYASWSTSAYNTFTLNAGGIANINKTGISKFGACHGWDIDNSFTGTWASGATSQANSQGADNVGTTSDPVLTVTHAAVASSKNLATTNVG